MDFVKEISISLCSNTIAYSFHNASQGVLKKKKGATEQLPFLGEKKEGSRDPA